MKATQLTILKTVLCLGLITAGFVMTALAGDNDPPSCVISCSQESGACYGGATCGCDSTGHACCNCGG